MSESCAFDPTRECQGLRAAERLEYRVQALEGWRENSRKFHEDFYDWQRGQIARESTLDEKINTLVSNVEKLVERQEQDDQMPAKMWNKVIETVVTIVVSAVVGGVLVAIGLKV